MAFKREHQRVRIGADNVVAQIENGPTCVVQNLSLGGAFVMTEHRFPVGATFTGRIKYREVTLKTEMRVTHLQRGGVGFSFCGPSDRFRATVGQVIDDLVSTGAMMDYRLEERVPVDMAIVWDANGERIESQLKNLSVGGAFVVTNNPPEEGKSIWVYLAGYTYSRGTRNPSEVRGCEATVMRVDSDGFAVHFDSPSAEFCMALDELLSGDLQGGSED